MSIYKDMKIHLESALDTILQTHGIEKGLNNGRVMLSHEIIDYLDIRRDVSSNLACRAQDSIQHHLSWHIYLTNFMQDTPLVDMVAWEMWYDYLHHTLGIPYEQFIQIYKKYIN